MPDSFPVLVANPPWPGKGYGARSNVRWPHRRGDKKLAFPVYLATAVSVLKNDGFDATGMDAVAREMGIDDFADSVSKLRPRAIFLEVSTPSIDSDIQTADALKRRMPEALIVFMGPHVSVFHEELLKNNHFVDACIRREFEYTVRDVCLALREGKGFGGIKGLTYRRGGEVVVNAERPLIQDLDELPWPDRNDFKIEDYQQAFYKGKKTALIVTSRGCPYQCIYCLWPATMYGHVYRKRSPKNTVDEIEHLINAENIDEVFFDDDEFTLDRERVEGICEEIIRRGLKIKWHCMGRANNLSDRMLGLMKRAGCYQIFYGFESGSQDILNSIKKGITKQQMKKAVSMTQKAGIVAGGSFILGLPEDDKKTAEDTIRFAVELGADWVQFTYAAPFPGTEYYEIAKRQGWLDDINWSDFDGTCGPIVRTKSLTRKEIIGLQNRAYKVYYTSPKIISKNLRGIRSLRDVKRVVRGARSVLSRIAYYKK